MESTNIALEIFGIIICIPLIWYCFAENHIAKRQSKLLLAMLINNVFVLFSDMMTWILNNRGEYRIILYILNFFVYSLGYVITALFTYYMIDYISEKEKTSIWIAHVIAVFCVIAIVLVAVSLWNHMYFFFDEQGVYHRGSLYWVSQVYPLVIMIIDMGIIIAHYKIIGIHDVVSFLSYGVLPMVAMVVQLQFYGLTLLYVGTTVSLLIIYISIHEEHRKRLQEKETELAQMRMSIMLSQIQPHFLYNALNTIQYLCHKQPEEAAEAVGNFACYLRGNMDSLSKKEPILFEKELNHLENYLAIECLRFPDIEIHYDIECENFVLPALTLQPLVENAIRYGVTRREEGGKITISTWEDTENYYLQVEDNGVGFNPMEEQYDGRSHIGISNTRNRLSSMCRGTLTIESEEMKGTKVKITLPKGGKNENTNCG